MSTTTDAVQAEADYFAALVEQLSTRGSIALTADGLAWLLAAVVRPPEVPHPDLVLLWRALATADPDLARDTWRTAWTTTPAPDRLALCVIAARVPDLDTTN